MRIARQRTAPEIFAAAAVRTHPAHRNTGTAVANLAAPIQRIADPDGKIWKKFRDCAYAAGFSKYYVNIKALKEIIKQAASEPNAWGDWVKHCQQKRQEASVFKAPEVIAQQMADKKKEIEKLGEAVELKIKDVPEKKSEWDAEETEMSISDELPTWMKSPTRIEDYEDKLEKTYPQIQNLTEEAFNELYMEEGFTEKKEDKYTVTERGEQLKSQLLLHSEQKKPLPLSMPETDFLLNHFIPPKTGSIAMSWREDQVPLTLNFQKSNTPISSTIIPGIGKYDEHLLKLQEQQKKSGLPKSEPLHFREMRGTKTEREKQKREEMETAHKKRKAEVPMEVDYGPLAEQIVKEEDKTKNLQILEQSRNHRDFFATNLAYEGSAHLWPIFEGLDQKTNPMYDSSATTAVNTEKKTGEVTPVREKMIKTSKETILKGIKRSKDEKYAPVFKSKPALYHDLDSMRSLLKNPNDPGVQKKYKERVKKKYPKKKKKEEDKL